MIDYKREGLNIYYHGICDSFIFDNGELKFNSEINKLEISCNIAKAIKSFVDNRNYIHIDSQGEFFDNYLLSIKDIIFNYLTLNDSEDISAYYALENETQLRLKIKKEGCEVKLFELTGPYQKLSYNLIGEELTVSDFLHFLFMIDSGQKTVKILKRFNPTEIYFYKKLRDSIICKSELKINDFQSVTLIHTKSETSSIGFIDLIVYNDASLMKITENFKLSSVSLKSIIMRNFM